MAFTIYSLPIMVFSMYALVDLSMEDQCKVPNT